MKLLINYRVMPDITMCLSHECPLATKCWRFSAEPDRRQSYSFFEFVVDESGKVKCEYFTPIKQVR